jgi:DNA-directed RNA polymerase specialized sigma24 family protein
MTALTSAALVSAHQQFESALPVLKKNFEYLLRGHWRDREDLMAESYACAWKAFRGLVAKGRDPVAVGLSGIAAYATRHTLKGRRIGNTNEGGRHKMSVDHRRAQHLGGYKVVSYDTGPTVRSDFGPAAWKEWVATDPHTTPADAAAFRLDFASWLASLPERRRVTAELLAEGRGTLEVSGQVGITPAAVSQARSWLEKKWREYQQEAPAALS